MAQHCAHQEHGQHRASIAQRYLPTNNNNTFLFRAQFLTISHFNHFEVTQKCSRLERLQCITTQLLQDKMMLPIATLVAAGDAKLIRMHFILHLHVAHTTNHNELPRNITSGDMKHFTRLRKSKLAQ